MTNNEIIQAAKEAGLQLSIYAETYPNIAVQLGRFSGILEREIIKKHEIPKEALQAIKEACIEAMHYTVAARIPECGNFGRIAQNLSFALQEIAAIRKLGEQ